MKELSGIMILNEIFYRLHNAGWIKFANDGRKLI